MSCGGGNRFQCGVTRFQKHSFTPDKPSNSQLHSENEKRLSDLLRAREDLDKSFTIPIESKKQEILTSASTSVVSYSITPSALETPIQPSDNYTPWTIPSTQHFSK